MFDAIQNNIPVDEIRAYCQAEPIQRLYLLPSDYNGYLRPDMDVGMMVEYEPDAPIGYFELGRNERELGAFVNLRVDLHTPGEITSDDPKALIGRASLLYENGA